MNKGRSEDRPFVLRRAVWTRSPEGVPDARRTGIVPTCVSAPGIVGTTLASGFREVLQGTSLLQGTFLGLDERSGGVEFPEIPGVTPRFFVAHGLGSQVFFHAEHGTSSSLTVYIIQYNVIKCQLIDPW